VGGFWKQRGSCEREFTIKRARLQQQSAVRFTVQWRPQLLEWRQRQLEREPLVSAACAVEWAVEK